MKKRSLRDIGKLTVIAILLVTVPLSASWKCPFFVSSLGKIGKRGGVLVSYPVAGPVRFIIGMRQGKKKGTGRLEGFNQVLKKDWPYILAWLAVAAGAWGCLNYDSPLYPILCRTKVDPPTGDSEKGEKGWKEVLADSLDENGMVDYQGLRKNPKPLYDYVAYVAKVSPKTNPEKFPTKESKLAYYINAYNALAIYDIVKNGSDSNPESFLAQHRRFFRRNYLVGGEWMSLLKLEKEFVHKVEDPRTHFILNCSAKGCPILPNKPIEADALNETLDTASKNFLKDPRNVQVDEKKGTVRVSWILDYYQDDFTRNGSLIDYINQFRETKIPAHYKVEVLPYDWSLNSK